MTNEKTSRIAAKPIISKILTGNMSSRNGATIKRIVLHYTSSRTINGTIEWFKDAKSQVSAHYIVSQSGDIVQMVEDSQKAWHCYGNNADTIGIENCAQKGDKLTDSQSKKLAELLRYLKEEYHLLNHEITGHRFTDANKGRTDCPGGLWISEMDLQWWLKLNCPDNVVANPQPTPVDTTFLSVGMNSTFVSELHKNLVLLKRLGAGDHGSIFTEETKKSVQWFQRTNGLVDDGIVGPKTVEAILLAVSLIKKNKTIENSVSKTILLKKSSISKSPYTLWENLISLVLTCGDTSYNVASGQPYAQNFRLPSDSLSVPGNMEPLPQGIYKIGELQWYNKVKEINYDGPQGIGSLFIPLIATFGDDRGAFGIHIDANMSKSPGSAGCVVIALLEHLQQIANYITINKIAFLDVDWGL